jgi:hypothetical protein
MKFCDQRTHLVGALLTGILMLASCGGDGSVAPDSDGTKQNSPKFQQGATQIISTTGEVTVFDKGRSGSRTISLTDGRNPRTNEALGSGTRITTGPYSEAILLFSNGSYATLGPESDLLIDSFEQQEFDDSDKKIETFVEEVSPSRVKLDLDFGELILKVRKLKRDSSLEIGTPFGIAGVRGTQFRLNLDKDAVDVSVLSGSVEFIDKKKVARTIDKQRRLVTIKRGVPKQSALSPDLRSRIETVNRASGKKMTSVSLQKLFKAYEEVNSKQSLYDQKRRLDRLLAAGGKKSTDAAVKRGLDWLKAKQDPDGSWGANAKDAQGQLKPMNKNAMTGMALLCFFGHGDFQDSADYGETVLKALRFLTADPPKRSNIVKGSTGCYAHAIRTQALCEAYSMTKLKMLEPWAKTAAETVVKGQNESGGWAYGYGKGQAAHIDLSVTGWNIDALTAAALSGLYVEGLGEAMDKAIAYVKRCQDKTGKFAYKEGSGGKASLTGMGVTCLQVWNHAKAPEALKGLEWIVANQATNWSEVNVYEWHRSTRACFQATGVSGGRKYWDSWNKDFQDIVCGAQLSDGSWPSAYHFHGDSDVFRTTMAIHMLEVYYYWPRPPSR